MTIYKYELYFGSSMAQFLLYAQRRPSCKGRIPIIEIVNTNQSIHVSCQHIPDLVECNVIVDS